VSVKKSSGKAPAGRPASSTRPAAPAAKRPGTAKLKPVQDRLDLQRAQVRRDADASYQDARKNGIGGSAIRFWDEAGRKAKADTDSGRIAKPLGQLKQAGAGVMKFLAQMSNVAELEGSAAKLGYLSGSGVATRGDLAKASAVTALDAGLAATNFIGVGGIVKGSARRAAAQQLIRQGEARFGAAVAKDAVKGMLKARPSAAASVADDLKRIVGTLPDQGKLGAKEAEAFLGKLQPFAARYGMDFQFGKSMLPEVHASATKVSIKTMGGGTDWHEYVHVVQTLQNRATALASQAERLGKPIAKLTGKEVDEAFTFTAKTFENQAYRHFEEGAVKATGFMAGALRPDHWKKVVGSSIDAQAKALVDGVMPNFRVGLGGKLYGDMTALGQSQAEILMNFGAPATSVVNHVASSGLGKR